MQRKNILLIEPGYPNKYPPLGLMKIAAYHGPQGRRDHVRFVKGEDYKVLGQVWDRVYVTTLFSFEWNRTSAAIDFAMKAARGQAERVFVGGIAATLMFDDFVLEPRWAGVRFISGLLDEAPAHSLQLSQLDGDFGFEDVAGTPIEELVPDYGILEHIKYSYPVRDAYFGYASRGCVRKCSFCGVPKLEGAQREMPPISSLVIGVQEQFGSKKDLVLMDNNVAASARYRDVVAEIRDLGFERGAIYEREDGSRTKRRVDFNQGVDARILAKAPMYLKEMATICIDPLRIAFDHVGMRRVYEKSVRMAAEYGLSSLSNYMLYNFLDNPADLYERMAINIELNSELGVRIWSFPMRYLPVTMKDRSHVGKGWNRYFLRSFQIMLQATHGVVSGSSPYFLRAFGAGQDEFERLLWLPHAFIFHREYYENGEGRAVLDEYTALYKRLSDSEKQELLGGLCRVMLTKPRKDAFRKLVSDKSFPHRLREIARFYAVDRKASNVVDIAEILPELSPDALIPEPEAFVEDAGLNEDVEQPISDLIPLRAKV